MLNNLISSFKNLNDKKNSIYITQNNTHKKVLKVFYVDKTGYFQRYYGPRIKITYDANGGTFASGESTNEVYYDTTNIPILLLDGEELIPLKDNTTFNGWYTEDINQFNITSENVEDITVYAHWHDDLLKDFEYIDNPDGTYTITDWRETYDGVSSTKLILPDNDKIIL